MDANKLVLQQIKHNHSYINQTHLSAYIPFEGALEKENFKIRGNTIFNKTINSEHIGLKTQTKVYTIPRNDVA